MKKTSSFVFVLAGIIAVAGLIFVSLGIAFGGSDQFADMSFEIRNKIPFWFGTPFDDDYPIYKGVYEKTEVENADGIENIELVLNGSGINVVESDDDSFYIEAGKNCAFQYYVTDNKLYVMVSYKSMLLFYKNSKVTLYVPKTLEANEIDIEVNAGKALIDTALKSDKLDVDISAGKISIEGGMSADTCDINVSAGDMNISSISVNELTVDVSAGAIDIIDGKINCLDIDISAGDMEFSGDVDGDIYIDISAGDGDLELKGDENDYNYKVDVSAGNFDVNGKDYGSDCVINNKADKTILVDVSAGDLNIDFMK